MTTTIDHEYRYQELVTYYMHAGVSRQEAVGMLYHFLNSGFLQMIETAEGQPRFVLTKVAK